MIHTGAKQGSTCGWELRSQPSLQAQGAIAVCWEAGTVPTDGCRDSGYLSVSLLYGGKSSYTAWIVWLNTAFYRRYLWEMCALGISRVFPKGWRWTTPECKHHEYLSTQPTARSELQLLLHQPRPKAWHCRLVSTVTSHLLVYSQLYMENPCSPFADSRELTSGIYNTYILMVKMCGICHSWHIFV